MGAGTQYGPTGRNCAQNHNVSYDLFRARGISSSQGNVKLASKMKEATQKFVCPFFGRSRREAQGKKAGYRLATHSCNVAESAGQAAMPYTARGMPFPAKMHTLDAEVRGYQQL